MRTQRAEEAGRIIRILREQRSTAPKTDFAAPERAQRSADLRRCGRWREPAARRWRRSRDDIGPSSDLGEDRDVGTPMIEEALDEFQGVDWRILMKAPAGKRALRTRADERCRLSRALRVRAE
jgi:hypothetical protein